ncbi:amidohydrolase family protein [Variovorax sp. J22R133]|uniref:amidohydrolase family protein n=1 Tax=Variovorax brevis TaxID=3053503 RepID=UPI00257742D8|nr:amidohydrolase family protein [Variovorax sp. J22R133]MDM0116508.1 amidohydrolase family protein [Variovorax sp. J22R133]
MIQRIDAHQHFWQPARGDYGWLRPDVPALHALYRDFMPEDLVGHLQAQGVVQTVLVQAAASEAETDFLLALAETNNFVGGVVGWVDLSHADAASTLAKWSDGHAKFKGVRPMLQDLADTDWIAHAPHPAAIEALQRLGLRFDALVKPPHLGALLHFVQAWPDLPVVIDHAAKPQLAEGWNAPWAEAWRRQMAELAAYPQVCCKLSGLLTEAPPSAGADALRPVWDHLLQCFGPERLMWGSDWPVLNLASDYASWVAISDVLVRELAPDEQASVRQGCATRFYGLPTPHA